MPDPALQPIPAPDLRRITAADGTRRFVVLSGTWNLQALESRLAELAPRLAEYAADPGFLGFDQGRGRAGREL
jgi:hypothetical protein